MGFQQGPTSFITYSNVTSLRILIVILILFADDSTVMVIARGKTLLESNTNAETANGEMVKIYYT